MIRLLLRPLFLCTLLTLPKPALASSASSSCALRASADGRKSLASVQRWIGRYRLGDCEVEIRPLCTELSATLNIRIQDQKQNKIIFLPWVLNNGFTSHAWHQSQTLTTHATELISSWPSPAGSSEVHVIFKKIENGKILLIEASEKNVPQDASVLCTGLDPQYRP